MATALRCISLLLLIRAVSASQQNYQLTITNKNQSPDGVARNAIAVNDGVQGPLLTGNKGDTFSIDVKNQLTTGPPVMHKTTSIHWHGIIQDGTQDEDGVAFVGQCPIVSGNDYPYKFPIDGQAGTFWYHSHFSTQYCDGLRGPLVVYDPNDPQKNLYDIDNAQTVLTLADWYAVPSLQSFPEGPVRPAGRPPIPISHLLNGQGRRSNTSSPLAVVPVTSGKRYRFRLISMACDAVYTFWIEGHQMTVIETDGVATQPSAPVDSLTIYDAQRYSIVVNASQPVANYWIRFQPAGSTGFANNVNSGILRYAGAPNADPTSSNSAPSGPNALDDSKLVPLVNPGAPDGSNVQKFTLNIAVNSANNLTINTVPFIPPSVPVLLQILNGADANSLLPAGSIIPVEKGQIVEVTIPGGSPGAPHPFHLHGHTMDVIRSVGQTTTNLANPPRRDVVNTGSSASDQVTFRFNTDNPGPWILHCHIDWHLDLGLAIVFAERTSEVKSTDNVNSHYKDLCPAYNALAPGDL